MWTSPGVRVTAAALIALVLSGCVEVPAEGTPVPPPTDPVAVVYKMTGGDLKYDLWLRVAFRGTLDLAHDDGLVRPTWVFDSSYHDAAPPADLTPSLRDMQRHTIDPSSGRTILSASFCTDAAGNHHCPPQSATLRNGEGFPFLWATSFLWGTSWRADERVTIPIEKDGLELYVTWRPKADRGDNTFTVETSRDAKTFPSGIAQDFEGAVHFAEGASFPKQVSVSRVGHKDWDSILILRLESESSLPRLEAGEAVEPYPLPAADTAWTGFLPPGSYNLPLGRTGTFGKTWDSISSLEDFKTWTASNPDPYLMAVPSRGGGSWRSGPCMPPACVTNETGSEFEVNIGAPTGAEAMAEVRHWQDDGLTGATDPEGSSATFQPIQHGSAQDPRPGRPLMDASRLPDLACGLDERCETFSRVQFAVRRDGAAYYGFVWDGDSDLYTAPNSVWFWADAGRLGTAVIPLSSAERFVGPLD